MIYLKKSLRWVHAFSIHGALSLLQSIIINKIPFSAEISEFNIRCRISTHAFFIEFKSKYCPWQMVCRRGVGSEWEKMKWKICIKIIKQFSIRYAKIAKSLSAQLFIVEIINGAEKRNGTFQLWAVSTQLFSCYAHQTPNYQMMRTKSTTFSFVWTNDNNEFAFHIYHLPFTHDIVDKRTHTNTSHKAGEKTCNCRQLSASFFFSHS